MKKETIVLLPGYDGDGQGTFVKLKQLLEPRYHCIVVNYPYYRQTTKAYTMTELVDYIDAVVKEENLSQFHLLGFSMGGLIGTQYAIKKPDDMLSLSLVSSSVVPNLSRLCNFIIWLAYYAFKWPFIARFFSSIYTSKIIKPLIDKYSPLPLPRDNFPRDEGYPVFGTLANVLFETERNNQDQSIIERSFPKLAILFKDDHSFPADAYTSLLTNLGFKVIVKSRGGHAESRNYWNQVAQSLYR